MLFWYNLHNIHEFDPNKALTGRQTGPKRRGNYK